jgi:hypothetical protein
VDVEQHSETSVLTGAIRDVALKAVLNREIWYSPHARKPNPCLAYTSFQTLPLGSLWTVVRCFSSSGRSEENSPPPTGYADQQFSFLVMVEGASADVRRKCL